MYYLQDSATHIFSKYSEAKRRGFKSHAIKVDTAVIFKCMAMQWMENWVK